MKRLVLLSLICLALSACARQLQQPDARIGTEMTPYRSIPAYIECGDCRMQK